MTGTWNLLKCSNLLEKLTLSLPVDAHCALEIFGNFSPDKGGQKEVLERALDLH